MTETIEVGREAIVPALGRDAVGENPIWDAALGRWWWIDIPSRAIRRYDPATGGLEQAALPERIGCLALTEESHGFVAGCESGLFSGRLLDGGALEAVKIVDVTHPAPGMRFNDGRVDRQGRFRLSTMVMDIALGSDAGQWFVYDRRAGLSAAVLDGFVIPNGAAVSPDGRTFYCSDTHRDRRRIFAFDLEPETGRLANRRLFATIPEGGGRPDGGTVDAAGFYWSCCLDAGRIHRFAPDGSLDRVYVAPMLKPTNCGFGGDDLGTLFVTSLCRGPADLESDPDAGRVLIFRPGIVGLAEPRLTSLG